MEVQKEIRLFQSVVDSYKDQYVSSINNYKGYEKLFSEPYFQAFVKSSPLVVAVYNYVLHRYSFVSDSVSQLSTLSPKDFMKEDGIEGFMKAMDEKSRVVMNETIMPRVMEVCTMYRDEIKNLRFSVCLQSYKTPVQKTWILLNMYILEATPDGFPLLTCTLVHDVGQIKKDELIYFSEKLLKNDKEEILRFSTFPDTSSTFQLSVRELEVLRNICTGLNSSEIADKMHVSLNTIKKHRANILQKSGASNTPELINKATLMGII